MALLISTSFDILYYTVLCYAGPSPAFFHLTRSPRLGALPRLFFLPLLFGLGLSFLAILLLLLCVCLFFHILPLARCIGSVLGVPAVPAPAPLPAGMSEGVGL